jgi:uncharacterized protein (TIGR03086 family)
VNDTERAYRAACDPLTALLDAVPEPSWDGPSPCEGWTARDVVRHVVETQRDFLTGRGADLGVLPDVEADPSTAWREHSGRVLAVLAVDGFAAAPHEGFFGPTTVGETLVRFYVWDLLVHRWDVARTAGVDARLSEDELDRIDAGADGFGPALHAEGICRAALAPPPGATREVRVLARLGRAA